MKKFILLFLILILSFSNAYAQEKNKKEKTSLSFRVGRILATEITDQDPGITNISEYEPPSGITNNVAWAAVVVKMNQGRTIGIYDYVLKNKQQKVFRCLAIREMNNAFNADKWVLEKTDPKKLYTMVFKVEKPRLGKPEFNFHFNLPIGKIKDIPMEFQDVGTFTPSDKIPAEGIYGITPPKPKNPPKKPEPKKPEPKKPEPKKNEPKKPEPKQPKLPSGKRVSYQSGQYKKLYYSSSQVTGSGIYFVLDGKDNTFWKPSDLSKQQWLWIGIPGEKQKLVKHIVIKWGKPYPKKFKLCYLDSRRADAKKTLIKQVDDNKGNISVFNVNKKVGAILLQNIGNSSDPKNKAYTIKEIQILE